MYNTTDQFCHKVVAPAPPPLFQNGKIVIQAYHIGWMISGSLALVAIITSFWLINKHLQWYTNKKEQRYLVRLLFMVPLYALISFGSFVFWNHATPIILVRDAYEAIVLTAFFYLLLMYLDHDTEEQKRIFTKRGMSVEADTIAQRNGKRISQWVFPLGFIKWKPKDGLYFLQLMKWGILQYCVIRPTSTLAAVILDYIGLYCESSWGLGWGHIYITIIMSISVTIAMYCLIQLYVTVAPELAVHKPLLKLFSVKAVVFLTFWQATFLSLLSMFGLVKDTKYMTAEDINIGIGAVLETFEMMIFAFLHIRAFSYKPYQHPHPKSSDSSTPPLSKTPQWRSLAHAMDFRETFREIWIGCVYMFDKMRGKEPTTDFGVIRETHYAGVFGMQRALSGKVQLVPRHSDRKAHLDKPTFPNVRIEVDQSVEIEVAGQRQWLMLGDYDRRGLQPKREKSEGLQEQIDRELERLGYPDAHNKDTRDPIAGGVRHPTGQRSWWRNVYNRISQSGPEADESEKEPLKRRRFSRMSSHRHHNRGDTELKDISRNIDDQPPRSILRPLKVHRSRNMASHDERSPAQDDISDLQSIVEDHLPLHHHHNPESNLRIASPVSPGQRATRSPPVASRLLSPNLITPTDGLPRPLSYDSPYALDIPIRSPIDLNQKNQFRLSVAERQGGSSSRLSGNSLVMSAPLDPYNQSNPKKVQYVWNPPLTQSKFNPSLMLPDALGKDPYRHRSSIHRREPAAVPQDLDMRQQGRAFPPSRARFSDLSFDSTNLETYTANDNGESIKYTGCP